MNFTWFASAFDTDDVLFRLLTLVQMAGVLVLAAGVPGALEHGDWLAVTIGYAVMRVGLTGHWIRAAVECPANRATALRYALGISVLQIGWIGKLVLDDAGLLPGGGARLAAFLVLVALELLVPMWAERRGATSWHPRHIAERYGLFAIIIFGESVLAASTGVQRALASGGFSVPLVAIGVAALVLVFALWWVYFLQEAGEGLVIHRERSYLWGYGHYGILLSLTAVGAGLDLAVGQTGHHVEASALAVGYALAIPVAAFIVFTWVLYAPLVPRPVLRPWLVLGSAGAILLIPAVYSSALFVVAGIAVVCALVVAVTLVLERERDAASVPDFVEAAEEVV